MAAGAFTLFSANKDDLNLNDLVGAGVKMALLASTYSPDYAAHDTYSDVSAHEIANGNGYATGGLSLTGKAATAITGGFKFSSDHLVWTASGAGLPAWRYGVMYVSGSLWGLTNPLIGAFIADTTPDDIDLTPAGSLLRLVCPSGGWFDVV